MKAIVAVDLNWGIGQNGKLLEMIPEDMKFFKETTIGEVVVMGRETYNSLPGKSPLKDRVNIVLSKNESFNDDRVIICRSLEELKTVLKQYNDSSVYIVGGENIYNQLIDDCSDLYITKIYKSHEADKYFPNIEADNKWELYYESEEKFFNDVRFKFTKYRKKQD